VPIKIVQDEYIYEFGPFQLNPAEHLLLCNGQPVPVTAKAFQTLLVLVRNRGHLVDKSQIINAVWGETFVEEGNLSVTISMLRKVLGDDRSNNKYIETVSKQGYRFLPVVTQIPLAPPNFPSEPLIVDEPSAVSDIAVAVPSPAEDRNAAKAIYRSRSLWLAASLVLLGFCIGLAFQLRSSSHASKAGIGKTLWSGDLGRSPSPISNLENKLETLMVETAHRTLRAVARSKEVSDAPGARQLYIEGRYFWNKRTKDGFRHSIECFQRAVLKDPGFANAYAGLADSYVLLASYGIEPPEEAYPNAQAAALKALQLDDSLAEAHTSLGMVALYYEWDWPKADQEFRRAIELNPNYSLAYTWDALYFAATGQTEQAVRQAAKAREIEPLSLLANRELGRAFYWNHEYDKAIANFRHTIELDPYWARGHTGLGMALLAEKDYAGGIQEFQEARKLSGSDAYLDGLIAYSEVMSGNAKGARRILADLTDQSQNRYVPAFSVALVYLGLNQRDQAMDWLEKAYKDRSTYMVYAKVDPLLSPLRNEPRFIALISRMGGASPEQASANLSSK
jgi:DNA-binding winged helix-turn-helix (wHTH) protein/Flp pilus assembly protein TadD